MAANTVLALRWTCATTERQVPEMPSLKDSREPQPVSTPLVLIDRSTLPTRVALVAAVKFHTSLGTIVRVEDGARPLGQRLCYEVRSMDGGNRLLDASGQHLGLFASIAALVDFAERKTVA